MKYKGKQYKFGRWNTGLAFLCYHLSIPFVVVGLIYIFAGYL